MKKLSIVLPTYNRKEYLEQTLEAFAGQMSMYQDEVSFIVCNNASTDGTDSFLAGVQKKYPFYEYINFTEHVAVGYSLSRAIEQAKGEYVLMWGDDDLPAPFMLSILLSELKGKKDVCLIHFNRLVGYDNKVATINKVSVLQNNLSWATLEYKDMNSFLNKYVLDLTFMSSFVFKKTMWGNVDTGFHYGYEFLGKILHGYKPENKLLYLQYPLCIQRKPFNRPWMNKSPYYRFIGIPNMYSDFEKWGLIDSAKELWMRQGNTTRDFLSIMSQTSVYKKEYRPLFKQIVKHQYSFTRKFLTFFFVFISPAWLYKFIRKRTFR